MNEIENFKKRLFSVIPTSSLHMFEFLKLTNIRFTETETESVAVTCCVRPELLLNKKFIEQYCKTDEHLFMLIMHELYHIILGHTRLFSNHSPIDNIAFDAIINALLCRNFPGEEYTSFFTQINCDDSFPGALLRPIGSHTPSELIPVLKSLYLTQTGTYYEIYQIISQKFEKLMKDGKCQFVLLGDHKDKEKIANPILKKMVEKMVDKWPKELTIKGKDLGSELDERQIDFAKTSDSDKKKMKRLLRKSGVTRGNVQQNKTSIQTIDTFGVSFIPNYQDRTLAAKKALYQNPILFKEKYSINQIKSESNIKSLVYLDVSGSVVNDINDLASLLQKPYKNKECQLFVFSTEVVPVTYEEFKQGKYKTTGGTSIDCVFKHYFSLPKNKRSKKILILTDGYTGEVSQKFYELIRANKIEIYCGLFSNYTKVDLESITKCFEEFN